MKQLLIGAFLSFLILHRWQMLNVEFTSDEAPAVIGSTSFNRVGGWTDFIKLFLVFCWGLVLMVLMVLGFMLQINSPCYYAE